MTFQNSRLTKLYVWLLGFIMAGLVFHAPITVYLSSQLHDYTTILLVKSWKEILLILAALLGIYLVTRARLWAELARSWLFQLITAFVAVHFVLLVWQFQGISAALAGLAIDLRYSVMFSLVYVALLLAPQYRRLYLRIILIGAAIVVGFGALQLILPANVLSPLGYGPTTIQPYLTVDQNTDYIRVNSTLRGPNPLGAFAAVTLVVLLAGWRTKRFEYASTKRIIILKLIVFAGLISLYISYSRSALIGLAAGALTVLYVSKRVIVAPRLLIVGTLIGGALIGGLFAASTTPFVSTVILHEDPNGGSIAKSNDGHIASLQNSTSQFLNEPLGSGIGSSGSASLLTDTPNIVESQFFFVAHESGWIGLLLFIGILCVVLRRAYLRRPDYLAVGVLGSGVCLAAIGVFLPVWTDDTISMLWWCVAAIALSTTSQNQPKNISTSKAS